MENVSQVAQCPNLQRIRYPETIKELSFNAIIDCPDLKSIEVSKEAKIDRDAIVRCGNCEIIRY